MFLTQYGVDDLKSTLSGFGSLIGDMLSGKITDEMRAITLKKPSV